MFIKRTPVALALASALFSAAVGAAATSHVPAPLDVAPERVGLKATNPLVAPDGKAAIIIILKGEPAVFPYARVLKAGGGGVVAQSSANSAAHTAIDNLRNAQASFVTKLKAAGIQYDEIYRVQRVLNGIAVRMKPEDMAKVRALPNVDRVQFLPTYKRPDNIASVPFVNAPQVWAGGTGLGLPFNAKGEGIKIGDIDTGLDFVHPDFGGTGLLANYQDIDPTSVIGKNSHNIIFPTSKVVGGTDFAGDDYDASNAPQPDPNPMDCGGHGSHTAGTLAGLGVNADGTPYTGLYNPVAPYAANLKIGPGMAPAASLYALRVFGCGGSTNLVAEAIDWAIDPNNNKDLSDHLDVINMSLGSPTGIDIGDPKNPNSDIEAVKNAVLAGVIVVSAAGNSGDTFFINGSPAAANVGISAAASVDPSVPGVVLTETAPVAEPFTAAASAYANPTGFPPPPAPANQVGNVVQVLDASGGLSRGCGAFSNAAAISGNFALIDRGTCTFVTKVQNAQAAGATGVIVVDSSTSPLPIVMGGTAAVQITIPGISISKGSGTIIKGQLSSNTVTTTFTAASAADTLASFSSRGPVTGVGGVTELKPDIAAPGLNIPSVQTGFTCNGGAGTGVNGAGCIVSDPSGFIPGGKVLTISGTSMATPHIAGLMALLRQLNPKLSVEELKAMALNGAAHDITLGANATPPLFGATRVGAGRIDAAASATSKVIAFNQDVPGAVSVTFDVEPVGLTQATHTVKLENLTASDQTVTLSLDTILDSQGVSFSLPSGSILVPASGSTTFTVTMNADTAQMKHTFDQTMATTQARANGSSLPRHYLAEESALIKVLDGSNAELARLPVYAATRPHSTMTTAGDLGSSAPLTGTTNLALSGQDVCTGTLAAGPTCNFGSTIDEESFVSAFELQLAVPRDPAQTGGFANLHYFGVNSQPDVANRGDYFFGIAAYNKWGTPKDVSYNVCIDSDNDGNFDKIVSNTDLGTFDQLIGNTTQAEDTFIALIYDNVAGTVRFDFPLNLATAAQLDTGALSNNTMILGATGLHLGLAAGVTKFKYGVAVCPGFDPLCGAADWVTTTGTPNCGAAGSDAIASFNGPFTYDSANPGVDGQGNVLDEDLNGGTLAVNYDATKLSANGSSGILLLHSHNTAATSAQVVAVDRIFADGFGK